ncbi:unnamed protein product [Coregonus sp. 'balchen']|nr:unnamed protein product [Coregonus sp. 'balchen']
MNKYKSIIKRVGQNHGVAPSIIAGIISRETRAGTGAGLVNVWGDNGNGFGLMQVGTQLSFAGGLAAYNRGLDNVHSYSRVDENTTGGDYSRDVLARATFYRSNGY